MIVIEYVELIEDKAAGVVNRVPLGGESHEHIEEVLLPLASLPNNPVFMTKKFAGVGACRWQVMNVIADKTKGPARYVVELSRPEQVPKAYYLRSILDNNRPKLTSFIQKNTIVEIEYGHPMVVGNGLGNTVDSRRYVDTVQKGSMPKRRLAIVNQVITGVTEHLIQVIPISSKPPAALGVNRAVDVSECLDDFVHYRRQSWAICDMLETVSLSRVFAPLIRTTKKVTKEKHRDIIVEIRDISFPTRVNAEIRKQLNDAMLYSIDQQFRLSAAAIWQSKEANYQTSIAKLRTQEQALRNQVTAQMTQEAALLAKVAGLEAEIARIATYMGGSIDEIEKLFG